MTRRLFAYIGLPMLIAYAAVFYYGVFGFALCCIAGIVCAVFQFFKRYDKYDKRVFALIGVVIYVAITVFCFYDLRQKEISSVYDGKTVNLRAEVIADRYPSKGYYNYLLRAEEIDGKSVDFNINLSVKYELDVLYADRIIADVVLTKCDNNTLKSKGVRYYASGTENVLFKYDKLVPEDRGLGYFPVYVRSKMSNAARELISGDEGEFCAELTYGVRSDIIDDILQDFTDTGLGYLVVVSGLHMSIIAGMILCTRRFARGHLFSLVRVPLALFLVIMYMGVTGFSPSVVRSGIMVIICIIAPSFRRGGDSLNNLGLAAIILCAFNPYSVGNVGTLLSFASTLSIICVYPRVYSFAEVGLFARINENRVFRRRTNFRYLQTKATVKIVLLKVFGFLVSGYLISFSAMLPVIPITLLANGNATPFIPFYSMIFAPLVSFIIIFTVLTSLLFYASFLRFAAPVCADIARASAKLMIDLTHNLSGAWWWRLHLDPWGIALTLLLTAAVLAVFFRTRSLRSLGLALASAVVVAAVIIVSGITIHQNELRLNIIPSSGASTIQLSGSGVEAVLSAYGKGFPNYTTTEKLKSNFSTVNTLIISDDSLAESRYAMVMLQKFDVQKILMYYSSRTPEDLLDCCLENGGCKLISKGSSVRIKLGEGVFDNIFFTGSKLWQYVETGGQTLLIAPHKGDAVKVPNAFNNPDILITKGITNAAEQIKAKRVIRLSTSNTADEIPDALSEYTSIKLR